MPAEVVTIKEPASGSTAQVLVSLGFNCFSWRPALSDGPRELLWAEAGFADGEQRATRSGIPLLFPFPGRIGGGEFTFEGVSYQAPPRDPHGNALHGFAFDRPWRTVETSGNSVTAEFQASVDAAETLTMWPSDYRLTAKYTITAAGLILNFAYENTGDQNLPCAFGTHAYFRTPLSDGGSTDETVIQAPLRRQWSLENMLPVGSPQATQETELISQGLPLAGREFDSVYTAVATDGKIVTEVRDPASGRTVRQTTDDRFGCCVIYTPDHREAVCLEPYTCVPDPFRLTAEGHEVGLQVLAPGDSVATEITLEVIEP